LLEERADRHDVDRVLGQARRHDHHAVGGHPELRLADGDDRNRVLARTAIDRLVIDAFVFEEALGLGDHDRRVLADAQPTQLRDGGHGLRPDGRCEKASHEKTRSGRQAAHESHASVSPFKTPIYREILASQPVQMSCRAWL
jgi:hypothetical protein